MRIGIIWKNDYPWDVRIEKFSNTLAGSAHDVHILCSNKSARKREDLINGIKIHRLPYTGFKFLDSIISVPFYLNPFWLLMSFNTIKKQKIELIIIRDIPLIPISLILKKIFGIPLIVDIAEDYSAMYKNRVKKGGLLSIPRWLFKNPRLAASIERYSTKRADHIFVVCEESANRLSRIGIPMSKITIVGNTPELAFFKQSSKKNSVKDLQKDAFKIIYIGFLQEVRGLDIVIEALAQIKSQGLLVKLIIAGDGDYSNALKLLAKRKRIEDFVEFKGWVKNSLIPEYIADSDVGIIPHKITEHTETTIPNKLFDYMACGKPVIVSNAQPLSRIINEENCGLVFASECAGDFVKAVKRLLHDPTLCSLMGSNGKNAVKSKYNWSNDSPRINVIINNLSSDLKQLK